ncbi:MAG: sporulation integral membrane protein YtvI [Lachnospiraceae bacterium]|nr:sporulation integral membrane protein YtvI [Lachnospiraceae bacterium]
MKKSALYLKAAMNVVVFAIAIALVIWLLPKILVFFLPFVIGWIISLIANPVVKFFEEKIKFKRKFMSAIMIVLIIAVIILLGYGIIALLVTQGIGLAESVPKKWSVWKQELNNFGAELNNLFENLPDKTRETFANLGNSIETALSSFVANLGDGNKIGTAIFNHLSSGIGSIANALIAIIMVVLSAYLFTAEHNNLARAMEEKMPKAFNEKLSIAYGGLKTAVGGYFKAQLKIEVWVYLITLAGLLICRVEFAIIIALGIAVLDFLPFFGAGLIMVPWAAINLANRNYFLAAGLIITWAVGQLVRQLIQPKFVGDSVGFKALPTLILLFVGYKFKGVLGMILVIPIAMTVYSLYKDGLFDSFTDSIKILWSGMTEFRRLPEKETEINDEKQEDTDENR